MKRTYSVAIRTLGRAGNKYREELISLAKQTIQPERVIVYIAEGYSIPDFRIGNEEYVYVRKGMVAQRAIDYSEISSDYILLLDDDVLLQENSVEILLSELCLNDADAVVADTFKPQENNVYEIVRDYVTSMSRPHRSTVWGLKVKRNAAFSYNISPEPRAYLSQTGAGPASLWKKSSLLSISFKDELWLDEIGFAYGDDHLMFYKLFANGYKLLISYDCQITHLDAKTANRASRRTPEWSYKRSRAIYLLWYRSQYSILSNDRWKCFACSIGFALRFVLGAIVFGCYSLMCVKPALFVSYIKGGYDGMKYSHKVLDKLPNFIVKNNKSRE